MKFSVNSDNLCKGLNAVIKAVPAKPSIPVLGNILFALKGKLLRLTCSDGDLTLRFVLQVDNPSGDGNICLPAKVLSELLKTLPGNILEFDCDKPDTAVISWANGKSSLPSFNADDFPAIKVPEKESPTLSFSEKTISEALAKTLPSVSDDTTRPTMCGVFFDITESGTNIVATDSRRLSCFTEETVWSDNPASFILGKKCAATLKSLLGKDGEVKFKFNSTHVRINVGNTEIVSNLVTGKYPKYDSVIPKDNDKIVELEREPLLETLKRIAICADKASSTLKMALSEDMLTITSEDLGLKSSAKEKLKCSYSGEKMTIGLKAPNIISSLETMSDSVIKLCFKDPKKAVLIKPSEKNEKPENVRNIVMPFYVS